MRKLKIYLADFCYHNRHTLATRYTPLNVGFIAQFVNQQFSESVSISIDKRVETFFQRVEDEFLYALEDLSLGPGHPFP